MRQKKSEEQDELLSRNFGMSRAESRRLINQGGVRDINGEIVSSSEEVADGDEIRVGRKQKMIVRKDKNAIPRQ